MKPKNDFRIIRGKEALGGSSYAVDMPPGGPVSTEINGPLFTRRPVFADYVQSPRFLTCHMLACQQGMVFRNPERVGAMVREEGFTVTGDYYLPTWNVRGEVVSVLKNSYTVDRTVPSDADSVNVSTYVPLWMKTYAAMQGGWGTLLSPQDPYYDMLNLGYNAELLGKPPLSVLRNKLVEINERKDFTVVVTHSDALWLPKAHVMLVVDYSPKTNRVYLVNSWGVDGPTVSGNPNDGYIDLPLDKVLSDSHGWRCTHGTYVKWPSTSPSDPKNWGPPTPPPPSPLQP